jgi:type I restriction enzyme M protein
MDKSAEIQRDRKGNVLYDKESRDAELVKWDEDIDPIWPGSAPHHVPAAVAIL